MKIITATFQLNPNEPEDYQILTEMHAAFDFRWNGQHFEATSIKTSMRGIRVTAKAID